MSDSDIGLSCDSDEELELSQQLLPCSSILHLPNEILYYIFQFLPAEDLLAVRQVWQFVCILEFLDFSIASVLVV